MERVGHRDRESKLTEEKRWREETEEDVENDSEVERERQEEPCQSPISLQFHLNLQLKNFLFFCSYFVWGMCLRCHILTYVILDVFIVLADM